LIDVPKRVKKKKKFQLKTHMKWIVTKHIEKVPKPGLVPQYAQSKDKIESIK
jgi:hypothetical protein